MDSLHSQMLMCFVERAPNPLTATNLQSLIPRADLATLEHELDSMVNSGALIERPGPMQSDYMLPTYDHLPVRAYVAVGGVKVPRLISGDRARSEDVNIFFETLARRLVEIEAEAQSKFDDKLKSYWANVVTLFGAFIGVFSLIVGFLKTVPMEQNANFWSVLTLSFAQVVPLALVLGGFIWFLRAQFNRE